MKKGFKNYYYIFGIAVLIYFAFLTGKSVYQNWQTNQEAKKIKTEIETLEIENQNLKNQIAYYQTPSFKEKEARRKLGLVKPDEKVIILSKELPKTNNNPPIPAEEKSVKPNYQLWWEFFFKKS